MWFDLMWFSRQILENENLVICFSLAFICKKMPYCLKYSGDNDLVLCDESESESKSKSESDDDSHTVTIKEGSSTRSGRRVGHWSSRYGDFVQWTGTPYRDTGVQTMKVSVQPDAKRKVPCALKRLINTKEFDAAPYVPVLSSPTSSRFGTNSCPSVGRDPLAARLTFLQSQAIADSTRSSYQEAIHRYLTSVHPGGGQVFQPQRLHYASSQPTLLIKSASRP